MSYLSILFCTFPFNTQKTAELVPSFVFNKSLTILNVHSAVTCIAAVGVGDAPLNIRIVSGLWLVSQYVVVNQHRNDEDCNRRGCDTKWRGNHSRANG